MQNLNEQNNQSNPEDPTYDFQSDRVFIDQRTQEYLNDVDGNQNNDDHDYLDEPFPSSEGQPINQPAHPSQPAQSTQPNQPAQPAQPSSGIQPNQPAQPVPPNPADQPNQSAQSARPNHMAHTHETNQNDSHHDFQATPILVPIPNPVGRSKIRKQKQRKKRIITLSILAVIAAAILIVIFFPWDRTVTLNGESYTVKAHTTLQEAADAKNISTKAGNLLAIDGSIIEEGKGNRYSFTVNGQPEPDPNYEVKQNDVIEVTDGSDVTENFTEETITVPSPVSFEGVGAIHKYMDEGTPGSSIRKVGEISGLTIDTVQSEPTPEVMRNYNVDSGEDKVIALTFDDGPWKTYTTEILDILRDNNAKATFFTVGERITGLEDVVKRASDEGHQICTHTWDHAAGSGQGVNLGYMTDDEQHQEVLKGMEAISNVTGKEASKVIRVPGGNLNENTARVLSELSTAEIGWNIDTNDWKRPGASHLFNILLQASPGDVILMHDGGGDRSQTVQALRDALPILAEEGYRFVTIDELIEKYPLSDDLSDGQGDNQANDQTTEQN